MRDSLEQLLSRLQGYSPVEVAVELILIWVVVFLVVRFLRGTRGAGIIKGLVLLLIAGTLIIQVLAQGDQFQRLKFLYDRTLGFAAIALLVVFQPELRRALIRLGEANLFRPSRSELAPMIESVVEACGFLSKNQFGALIAIERSVGLGGIVEGGTVLNADVSARLLQAIFWPSSALHDLGVVIRGGKILAAGVQFPMAESGELPPELGSRHRAAVGLSQESDCLVIVVSEETGMISVAERGLLKRHLSSDALRDYLAERLLGDAEAIESRSAEATAGRTRTVPMSKGAPPTRSAVAEAEAVQAREEQADHEESAFVES